MMIRNLEEQEFEAAISLGEFAFQVRTPAENRAALLRMMKPHQHWGAFVDGELASKYTLNDLETWIHGKKYAMGGVAGVATWPEYRRQGLVAQLLVHSLEKMRANGQTVSFLHPFSIPFYRKFGWELYTDSKRYELKTLQLPNPPSFAGRVRRVLNSDMRLQPLYEVYASRYTGSLVRTEAWWRGRIFNKPGTVAVYEEERGEARGYVFYQVLDQTITVHELVTLDEDARMALLGFLRNHDSMALQVKLTAPADDPLPFLLPDPRIKQELEPYFMARVVDTASFVAAYPFVAAGSPAAVALRVRDAHAPWNDGMFTLAVDMDGRGTLAPVRTCAAVDGVLTCGIGALTAMLMGYHRPAFLHAAGMLTGSTGAVETLERLLPVRSTYLPDYF